MRAAITNTSKHAHDLSTPFLNEGIVMPGS